MKCAAKSVKDGTGVSAMRVNISSAAVRPLAPSTVNNTGRWPLTTLPPKMVAFPSSASDPMPE
eukprot:12620782-Ditylum_brightwellii.AAC.1